MPHPLPLFVDREGWRSRGEASSDGLLCDSGLSVPEPVEVHSKGTFEKIFLFPFPFCVSLFRINNQDRTSITKGNSHDSMGIPIFNCRKIR